MFSSNIPFIFLILQNSVTFAALRAFLTFTSVRELGLSNCRLHFPAIKIDSIPAFESYECRSIVVLKLAGTQVNSQNHQGMNEIGKLNCIISLNRSFWPTTIFYEDLNCYHT